MTRYFEFLDKVLLSGVLRVYDQTTYLQIAFNLERTRARDICEQWVARRAR